MIRLLEKTESANMYEYEVRALAKINTADSLSENYGEDASIYCELDTSYNELSLSSLNSYVNSIPDETSVTVTEAYISEGSFDEKTNKGVVDLNFKMTSTSELSEEDIENAATGVAEFLVEETCRLLISGEYTEIENYNDYSRNDYLGEREVTEEIDETAYVYVDEEVEYSVLSKKEM